MSIDTTATEPPRNWFLDLANGTGTEDLLRHAEIIRAKLAYARERSHHADARAYELRLADVERAIAIHNRRATEALEQQAAVAGLDAAVLRGLHLMRRHLDEGGHDWRDGTQMADVEAASTWLATEPRHAVDPAQRDRIAELEATVETMKAEVWEANEDNHLCGREAAAQGCLVANKPSDAVRTLANRYVEVQAQREVSAEQRDRIVTIADEAFGLGPVESLDATLTRIERGIFAQHKRLSELEAQREADLREAFLAGCERAVDAALGEADEAHALVARMWTALQVGQQPAQPALTADEVRAVVESMAREIMASRGTADEAWDDGDFAAVIADGVAEKLAGHTLSPEIMTRIERSVFEQHRRLMNLEKQREADLREAFLAGARIGPRIADGSHEHAAAEYARSKAGG